MLQRSKTFRIQGPIQKSDRSLVIEKKGRARNAVSMIDH